MEKHKIKHSEVKKEQQHDVNLTKKVKLRRYVHKNNVDKRLSEGWKVVEKPGPYVDLKSKTAQLNAENSGELVLMEKGE